MIPAGRGQAALADRDSSGLTFVAEMYGAQLDQLAALLDLTSRQARALAASWEDRKLAQSGVLGPGPPWVWLTRTGLQACGLRYAAAPPALPRLAHIRATAAVRLALQATPGYAAGDAHWRSERRLRSRLGGRLGARDHLPDAEVHWPDGGTAQPDGGTAQPDSGTAQPDSGTAQPDSGTARPGAGWAGECWAIEVELTPKTVSRTTAIMRELLARTGDYGCPAAEARVPGVPPRHARAIYLCSPAAASPVRRARDALGSLGARVEIRDLPAAAYLPSASTSRGSVPTWGQPRART